MPKVSVLCPECGEDLMPSSIIKMSRVTDAIGNVVLVCPECRHLLQVIHYA